MALDLELMKARKSVKDAAMKHLADVGEFHKGEMQDCEKDSPAWKRHKNMLDSVTECAKCFDKAEESDFTKLAGTDLLKTIAEQAKRITALENTIVPSGVSKVTPTAPRAVLRAGQTPMQQPPVALRFENLVKIEEE